MPSLEEKYEVVAVLVRSLKPRPAGCTAWGEKKRFLPHHLRYYLGRMLEENAYKWHHAVFDNVDLIDGITQCLIMLI